MDITYVSKQKDNQNISQDHIISQQEVLEDHSLIDMSEEDSKPVPDIESIDHENEIQTVNLDREQTIEKPSIHNLLQIEIDREDDILEPGVINYIESVGIVRLIDEPHTQLEHNTESKVEEDQAIIDGDISPVNSERAQSIIYDKPDLSDSNKFAETEAQDHAAGLRQAEYDILNSFKKEESKK